jgi:hypothetical protein
MSNTLENIIQGIKKIAESILKNEGPLNRIITKCNIFLALKGFSCINKTLNELTLNFENLEEYVIKLKKLLINAKKLSEQEKPNE